MRSYQRLWVLQSLLAVIGVSGVLFEAPLWLIFYVLGAVIITLFSLGVAFPLKAISGSLNKQIILLPMTALLLFLWFRGLYAAPLNELPPLEIYLPFALFWAPISIAVLIWASWKDARFWKAAKIIFQIGVSLALLVFFCELFFRIGYEKLPGKVKTHLREVAYGAIVPEADRAGRVFEIYPIRGRNFVNFVPVVNPYVEGDLNRYTCLAKATSETSSENDQPVSLKFDEFGFPKQSLAINSKPDVVTTGDSFSANPRVVVAWWRNITKHTLGLPATGSGTTEQYLILREFVLRAGKKPDVIVVQYFEGNDLKNNFDFQALSQDITEPDYDAVRQELRPVEMSYTYQIFLWARDNLKKTDKPGNGRLAVEREAPAIELDPTGQLKMAIDRPSAEELLDFVYSPVSIVGWSLDSRAGVGNGPGIGEVRVYSGNSCEGEPLVRETPDNFLRRTDVQNHFQLDPSYLKSGFNLSVPLTAAGQQQIVVCVYSALDGQIISRIRTLLSADCPFPITDRYGNQLAFLPDYQAMGTLDQTDLASSQAYQLTSDSLLKIKQLADEIGAEFVLLYIPTKLHTHLDGISDETLYGTAYYLSAFKVDPQNGFAKDPAITDPAVIVRRLRENVNDQRDLIAQFTAEHGIWFLDMTPLFVQEVQQGQPVFWPNDTHLNQHGDDVVHAAIQEFLLESKLITEVYDSETLLDAKSLNPDLQ